MSAPLEKLLRDARIDLVLSRIEKDPSIINEVVDHLNSEIRSVKFNSINVLGELGEKSEKAVPLLTSCLEDDDWSICREAARTLGKIGIIAQNALPKISKLLTDKEDSIRKEAAIALGRIGNPTSDSLNALKNALNDRNEEVRTEAANALGEIGSEAYEAIPELMESIKDTSWVVRTASAHAISQIGKGSVKAIPTLINAMQDDDWRVRYRVVNTLASMGELAVPALLEALNSKNKTVVKEALDCLGEIKIADPKIINSISNLLASRSEVVSGKAADALRSIGKESVPSLIEAYDKVNKKMKITIISSIGGIGLDAEEAIPFLIKILVPHEEINPFDLKERREQLYSKSFSSKLRGFFEELNTLRLINLYALLYVKRFSRSILIKVEAVRALGNIGKNSESVVSALEFALINPKQIVRRAAALSLGKMGSTANIAVPSLIEALEDRKPDVRWRASEALGIIGDNSDEVLTGLNELIHDKCDYVCESAINALDTLTEQ
ncbi:MAG: HEAT repeat domain-containing protein [Candidatus Heimdallarchaeota archaeon]